MGLLYPFLSSHRLLCSQVPCVIFFIRCIFSPRYLWKVSESGRVNMLVQDMNVPMVDKDQKEDRKKVLVDYFLEDRHNHELYAYTFFACEFLNFVNVLLQLLFMNFFLGGEFTTYGSDVISMTNLEQEQRSDPLSRVFPKVTQFDPTLIMSLILRSGLMLLNFQIHVHCASHQLLQVTKCTFHKFGPSGTVQKFDGLCVLPLNIINEKIYVFLWFWFVILAITTGIQVSQLSVSGFSHQNLCHHPHCQWWWWSEF